MVSGLAVQAQIQGGGAPICLETTYFFVCDERPEDTTPDCPDNTIIMSDPCSRATEAPSGWTMSLPASPTYAFCEYYKSSFDAVLGRCVDEAEPTVIFTGCMVAGGHPCFEAN
jgi:hypothetical protein